MESPVWKPKRDTLVALPGLCVMHGGPVGMHLPEHEHDEIQVEMHFTSVRGRTGLGSGEAPSFFSLIPSRKPHFGHWNDGSEVVVLLLDPSLMEQTAERSVRIQREIQSAACSLDPVIQSIGSTLRREFHSGGISDLRYLEAIGVVLSGHLIRRWTDGSNNSTGRGRLSPGQLRRAIDLVEGASLRGVSIAALAGELGMGEHRFSRLFRLSTGVTPYQFLIQKRLERARALLENTTSPIAELALELGFGSQSHFTSAFRQHFSITPAAYRRERNLNTGR